MFCFDEEIEGIKEIVTVVFADDDNIQRVNEENQVSIFNSLGTEGSCSHLMNIFVVSNKVNK